MLTALAWVQPRARLALLSIAAVTGAAISLPLLQFASPLKGPEGFTRLIPHADSAEISSNTLALLLMPALILLATRLVGAVKWSSRIAWILPLSLALVVLVATGSRTAIFAAAIGCAVVLRSRVRHRSGLTLLPFIVVVLAAGASIASSSVRDDLMGRVAIWAGIADAYASGTMKHSYGAFADMQQTSPEVVLYGWVVPFSAHNTYLQQFTDFGPIGLFGLLLMGATSIRAALRARSSPRASVRIIGEAALGSLIATVVAGFFESLLTTAVVTSAAVLNVMSPVGALVLLAPLGLHDGAGRDPTRSGHSDARTLSA